MRTSLLILAALFVLRLNSVAHAEVPLDGGDPPLLLYYPEGFIDRADAVDIAIASDGTLFVAYSALNPDLDDEVTVLRSTDGGDHWETWHVFGSPSADYSHGKMEIIGMGTADEQVVVAYRSGTGPDDKRVLVSYADAFASEPSWTTREALDFWDVPHSTLDIVDHDLAVGQGDQTIVAVAAVAEVDGEEFVWRYDVSLNSSLGFGTDQTVYSHDFSPIEAFRTDGSVAIALHDRSGDQRVQMVLGVNVEPEGQPIEAEIYQTGAGTWGIFGGFDPVILVATRDLRITMVDLAADIESDDLVFTSSPVFEAFASTNGGTNWVPVTLPDYDDLDEAQVTYGPGGFVLWGHLRFGDLDEYRPNTGITGSWTARRLMNFDSNAYLVPSAVADDPTRPGEAAVVASATWGPGQEDAVWFNGTWRDAPGYGVLEGRVQSTGQGDIVAAPAVGDIDGDGDGEIVASVYDSDDERSYVHVFQHDSSEGTDQSIEVLELSEASAPALFDADSDGDLEIFVGSARGGIRGFDHELNVLDGWPVDLPGNGDTWVSVAPVSGTAYAEIVAANADRVHLLDPLGSEKVGWPFLAPAGGEVVGRAAIGDVDDDGAVEIVAAFTTAVAIVNDDGTLQRQLEGPWIPSTGVSLADLDGNGDLEIVGPMSDGTLVVVNHDGTFFDPAFPFDTGTGAPLSAVSIADVETEGEPVLCFTAGDLLYAIRGDGTSLTGYPFTLSPTPFEVTEPIIGRVARPGTERPQLVTGADKGRIHVVTATGDVPRDWPRRFDEFRAAPPAIVDVDADGINELIMATGDLLFVMDMGTEVLPSPTRRWPQAGHDRSRSGCSDCIPREPASVDPSGDATPDDPGGDSLVEFNGAWPNPSTGHSTFAFTLPARAHVELTIYEPSGRRVRSLVYAAFEAGRHTVGWDVTDAADLPVASGTYFARMRVVRGSAVTGRVQRISVLR